MRGILLPFAVGAWVAALLAAAVVPSTVLAKEGVEARLDRPIPMDAVTGSTISVGWGLWVRDSANQKWNTFTASGVFVRLHGIGGKSTEAFGSEDWTGHFLAEVTVPPDGIDRAEIGLAGTACTAVTCLRSDAIFPVSGIGPRAGAPIAAIFQAKIDPLPVQIAARQPVRVGIWFVPRPGAAREEIPLPALVFVQLTDVEMQLGSQVAAWPEGRAGHFVAMVTFPQTGRYTLAAAVGDGRRIEHVFGESLLRLQVLTTTPGTTTSVPEALVPVPATVPMQPAGLPSGEVLVGLVVALVVGLGLFAFQAQRKRSRTTRSVASIGEGKIRR
jgi:hypothetical protein